MRNKKTLYGLGLLALVLVLGVGYATVSSVVLEFGGSATVKNYELRVDIEGVVDTQTGSKAVGIEHTLTEHGHADVFTLTDMSLNDEVTMTYTVKNHETDVAASLTEAVELEVTNDEYFDASYTITESTLGAGETTTIVVKVKLTKTPVVAEYDSTEVSFKINATPVDNKDAGIITFEIERNEFQAEKGMTWRQWIESDYNTYGVFADDSVCITEPKSVCLYLSDYSGPSIDDVIIEGTIYWEE